MVVVGGFDDDFVTRRCRPVWRPYLMALAGGWRGILTSRLGVDNLLQDFSFQTNMICAGLNSKWWALRKTLEMPAQHSFESWKIINLKLRLLCVTFWCDDTWRSYVYHMTIWIEPSLILWVSNTNSCWCYHHIIKTWQNVLYCVCPRLPHQLEHNFPHFSTECDASLVTLNLYHCIHSYCQQ